MGRASRCSKPPSQKKRAPAQRQNHPYFHVHEHKLRDGPTLGELRRDYATINSTSSDFVEYSEFKVITFDHLDPTRHHVTFLSFIQYNPEFTFLHSYVALLLPLQQEL